MTILKDYQTVEDLMLSMVGLDITGSTVIEATGMGGVLGNIPGVALQDLLPMLRNRHILY